jgi:hypothetical protein
LVNNRILELIGLHQVGFIDHEHDAAVAFIGLGGE